MRCALVPGICNLLWRVRSWGPVGVSHTSSIDPTQIDITEPISPYMAFWFFPRVWYSRNKKQLRVEYWDQPQFHIQVFGAQRDVDKLFAIKDINLFVAKYAVLLSLTS